MALILKPQANFFQQTNGDSPGKIKLKNILLYFLRYKRLFFLLLLGLGIGTILQLVIPFFTQAVVDTGIASSDLNFIYLILLGQLMIFVGSTVVDFTKSWILLHVSTRINLSLVSEYWIKLMKLPLAYFDTRMTGDVLQRLSDHKRIESFLTGPAISVVFTFTNLIVFSFVIVSYDLVVFGVFLAGSLLYFLWIFLFMKARRSLDFKKFSASSTNQELTIQLLYGMQEIRLNNCERIRRWELEKEQVKLFKLNISSLSLLQIQQGGAMFINQVKNVVITFFTAKAVIEGQLTLGGMLAIQYIIGQLNNPIQQYVQFFQSFQDARMSLERINEVHQLEDEEPDEKELAKHLPSNRSLSFKQISFKYPGSDNSWVLDNINMLVPQGKTTAIVGSSGSGKTTLLKILLKFYSVEKGRIKVGQTDLDDISPAYWRSNCGAVMQDGFIFSDTIANNIVLSDENYNAERFDHAIKVANIKDFINTLPMGPNTRIGSDGTGLSQGQKQRILIARVVYKDPHYIFFDEATNALDANNERIIMQNLDSFFKNKTVVVVAHRLSTVKNADQIIVLDNGKIVEVGTHRQLTEIKGDYYELIKNQLELGV
ncbi:MAG TPA: peptidase domain-containing ABC transporter [Chitinophagaceae bacterium]|nr:peptidase domain-containing ABC transporter [Chitinophagaceae bacterium]